MHSAVRPISFSWLPRSKEGKGEPLVELKDRNPFMRRLSPFLLALFAAGALAQSRPPKLEPLPEPPPPPAIPGPDEPQVRIPVQEGDKVEEIRDGGRVVMLKVTPPNGKPYYLVDKTFD
jgi:hypothetical protein